MRRNDAIADLSPPRKTSTGTVYHARVASTAPMPYLLQDGTMTTERRSTAELKRIVDKLPDKPITLSHPPNALVPRDDQVVGKVLSAKLERGADGVDHCVAELHVHDQETLDAIATGTRGISLGYTTDVLTNGEQTNCVPFHAAIVDRPRCTTCSLRGDRADCAGACSCKSDAKPLLCDSDCADESIDDDEWLDDPDPDSVFAATHTKRLRIARAALEAEEELEDQMSKKDCVCGERADDDRDDNEIGRDRLRADAREQLKQPSRYRVTGLSEPDRAPTPARADRAPLSSTDEDEVKAAVGRRDRELLGAPSIYRSK